MQYFKSLTTAALVEIIESTKKELYLALPSLHPEIENAVSWLGYNSDQENKNVNINLLIDFDAQTFRQGYGDYKSVEVLYMGEFNIKNLKNNRISFIISDEVGYYLFIESRSLIPADKETINAISIDPVSRVSLKNYFFPGEQKNNLQDELSNAIIEESESLKNPENLISDKPASVEEISVETITEIKTDLENNPPLRPDYKRIVEFYSNKFQYIKLKFEGANLQYRKIEIPPEALPVMDTALRQRLETKLNLFENTGEQNNFKSLNDFKAKITAIREKYLKKVKSREESLLTISRKKDFEAEIEKLKKELVNVKSKTINNIADQIEDSKNSLAKDLTEFFIANPKALFPDHPSLWENNQDYVKKSAKSTAERIIHHIRWPQAHLLVDEFKLTLQYSDITFEDLKNEDFITELVECELITEKDQHQIAEFGKGIELKNTVT